jgi:hypothetical protein
MTLTPNSYSAEAFPPAVLGRGYSDAELKLIKTIWTDTKQVAQQKMQLCIHLYELKKEMDANDPHAGSDPQKSRFWGAFENGDLPEYVVNDARRARDWIAAAEFATSGSLGGAPPESLLALTPSTVCNLARISNPDALKIAEQHLRTHEFIGHDAASYLAKNDLDDEVLAELKMWIIENENKALVPSVIRKVESDVRISNQPANTRTLDAAAFDEIMADVKQRAPQVAAQNRANEVKEQLGRGAKEHLAELEDNVRKYNSKLNGAVASIDELLAFLKSIDRTHGTQYLDELRSINVSGLLTVANDIERIKAIGASMLQIAELSTSSNPPSGIDMTTLNVDQL